MENTSVVAHPECSCPCHRSGFLVAHLVACCDAPPEFLQEAPHALEEETV